MSEPFDGSDSESAPADALDPVALAISRLAGQFADHPGFMWTRSGFEILHARWPAYPIGHGRRAALYTLAGYPAGTEFFDVDSIDQCTLLSVGRRLKPSAGPEHLFVAVWDEDLRDMSRAGLIEGVADDDEGFVSLPRKCLTLTQKAIHLALVYELTAGLHPRLLDRVDEFLEIDRCDAAVREAGIVLEQALRSLVGDDKLHGNRLIDELFAKFGGRLPMPQSTTLQLKAEFLRFFAYVRNEFAHKIHDLDIVAASRMLWRCSRLLHLADAIGRSS